MRLSSKCSWCTHRRRLREHASPADTAHHPIVLCTFPAWATMVVVCYRRTSRWPPSFLTLQLRLTEYSIARVQSAVFYT